MSSARRRAGKNLRSVVLVMTAKSRERKKAVVKKASESSDLKCL